MSGSPQLATGEVAVKLLRRLDTVCARLKRHEDAVSVAAGERNALFVELYDNHGVTQREIADRAAISEPAVAKAMRKARTTAEATPTE